MNTRADMDNFRQAVIRRGVLPETPLGTDYAPPRDPLETPSRKSWLAFRGPIREQGQEASCAAYGMLKVFEMEHLRLTGKQLDTSERFCYNLSRIVDDIPGDFIEQKGTTLRAAARVLRHYGLCDEADWPYTPDDKDHLDASTFLKILHKARNRRIAEYRNLLKEGVNDSTLSVIKRALCRRPVVCGLLVDENWLAAGPDGFIVPGHDPFGGHAVALAFFDDDLKHNGLNGWFGFVNSWSKSWGRHGLGYIDYHSFVRSLISCYEIVLCREALARKMLDTGKGLMD